MFEFNYIHQARKSKLYNRDMRMSTEFSENDILIKLRNDLEWYGGENGVFVELDNLSDHVFDKINKLIEIVKNQKSVIKPIPFVITYNGATDDTIRKLVRKNKWFHMHADDNYHTLFKHFDQVMFLTYVNKDDCISFLRKIMIGTIGTIYSIIDDADFSNDNRVIYYFTRFTSEYRLNGLSDRSELEDKLFQKFIAECTTPEVYDHIIFELGFYFILTEFLENCILNDDYDMFLPLKFYIKYVNELMLVLPPTRCVLISCWILSYFLDDHSEKIIKTVNKLINNTKDINDKALLKLILEKGARTKLLCKHFKKMLEDCEND